MRTYTTSILALAAAAAMMHSPEAPGMTFQGFSFGGPSYPAGRIGRGGAKSDRRAARKRRNQARNRRAHRG